MLREHGQRLPEQHFRGQLNRRPRLRRHGFERFPRVRFAKAEAFQSEKDPLAQLAALGRNRATVPFSVGVAEDEAPRGCDPRAARRTRP